MFTDTARFWAKVEKTDSCWNWLGGKTGEGYGQITQRPKNYLAHRVAYELAVGPIPKGLMIDHLCRNRACVNPAHMEIVTRKVNNLRGESPWASNARREACPKGHPYTPENTQTYGKGTRSCRTCSQERHRVYMRRKNAK